MGSGVSTPQSAPGHRTIPCVETGGWGMVGYVLGCVGFGAARGVFDLMIINRAGLMDEPIGRLGPLG